MRGREKGNVADLSGPSWPFNTVPCWQLANAVFRSQAPSYFPGKEETPPF